MSKDWTGNIKSIWAPLGASNHTEAERQQDDFYATDPIALEKLSAVFPIAHKVWEPMAGKGHLSEWLKKHEHDVLATDLVDRGSDNVISGIDFLDLTQKQMELILKWGWQHDFDIVTNPAYKIALPSVLKALEYISAHNHVIMFLKTTFLEGKTRKKLLFDVNPPRYIYQFSERVYCAKNGDFDYMKSHGGSAVAYCFMIWQKENPKKITEVRWL